MQVRWFRAAAEEGRKAASQSGPEGLCHWRGKAVTGVGKVETGKFLNGSIQVRDRGHSVMLQVSGEGKAESRNVLSALLLLLTLYLNYQMF